MKTLPAVDGETCTGCVACVDACDHGCLQMVDGIAKLVAAEECVGDQHCVAACPLSAIRMEPVAG